MYRRFIKRALDIILSGMGIVVLSPVLLLIPLLIKCEDKGPVFFTQKRMGIHKSYFNILKFRTMQRRVPSNLLSISCCSIKEPECPVIPVTARIIFSSP